MEFQRLTSVFDFDVRQLERGIQRATEINRNHQRGIVRGYQEAEREAGKSFQNITRQGEQSFARIEREARVHASRLSSIFSSVKAGFGSGSGSSGGFLPGLGNVSEIIQGIPQVGRLVGSLVSPFTQAAEAGIKFNAFLETSRIGFEKMLGSEAAARKHLDDLAHFAEKTPFQFEDLVSASQRMQAFGFDAKQVIPILTSVGDALSATGKIGKEDLDGVLRQFGQMRSVARVTAQDMNAITDHGVPAWDLLATAIGKSVAETRKLAEAGKLRGDIAVEAIADQMERRYGGMMGRISSTLTGRLSNLEDVRERAQGLATEGLSRDISSALGAALSRGDLAESMAAGINTAITPVSGIIKGAIVTTIGGGLSGGFQDAVNAAKAVLHAQMTSLGTEGIINPLKAVLGIQSPSKVTFEMGLMLAAGLQDGFAQGLRQGSGGQRIGDGLVSELEAALSDPRVRAFLEVIRRSEGADYNTLVGGRRINDLSRHPNVVGLVTSAGPSTAFGGYQITGSTDRTKLAALRGLDYSPHSQDLRGVELLRQTGALSALLSGDFTGALQRAGREWASLPGSPLPGRERSMSFVTSAYENALGRNTGAVDELTAAVRDLAASTNWKAREGLSPGFRGMTVDQQVEALDKMLSGLQPGFKESYYRQMSRGATRDLTGGLGEFIEPLPNFGSPLRGGLMLEPGRATLAFTAGVRDAKEAQFDLLKAIGETGPEAEENYGRAAQAARNWAKEIMAGQGKSFMGLNSAGIAGAVRSNFIQSFTDFKQGPGGMFREFSLGLVQSLGSQVVGHFGDEIQKHLEEKLDKLFNDHKAAAKQNADQITNAVNFSGAYTVNALHEMQNNILSVMTSGPGLGAQLLGTFLSNIGSQIGAGLSRDIFGGRDDGKEGPATGHSGPPTATVVRRAMGGPVPAWTPAILAEMGTEAVLFDRPGHVLNSNQTQQLFQSNWNNNTGNDYSRGAVTHQTIHVHVTAPPAPAGPSHARQRAAAREFGEDIAREIARKLGGRR